MKKIVFFLSLFFQISCSQNKQDVVLEKDKEVVDLKIPKKSFDNQQSNLFENDSIFPIEYIKKISFERKNQYRLDTLNFKNYPKIEHHFFKKWFENRYINNSNKYYLQHQNYGNFHFFDYKELKNTFLFTIFETTEYGYFYLFHFEYDKKWKKMKNINCIGRTGGDGGHSHKDILKYNDEGNILMNTYISTNDTDDIDFYIRSYDSVVYKIEFNEKTNFSKIDSLHKIDTVWNKTP
jgi:hypothetical protein